MKNKIILITTFLSALTVVFSSCENWLNVSPQSQVKDNELFQSETGFKEALAGVYATLVTESLYSKELRYGMIGTIAHEWTSFSAGSYPEAVNYDYTAANPEARINSFWEDMYNAIANANVILEVIDNKKSLFSGVNFNIIKGEAHALRAFIHFDLLRCFGMSYAADMNKPSIPYVEKYTPKQSVQLTVSEVLDKVIGDLEAAIELLKADPIYTGRVITEADDSGYLINRQLHLNYYAVRGLMARVYLYKHDYENAYACAREVIDSGVFTWVSQSALIAGDDPSGATEQLWAIDVNNLDEIHANYFTDSGFSLDSETRDTYYESNTDDYRYMYLFAEGIRTSVGYYFSSKFSGPASTNADNYYRNKMTMIKLSEMYYIIAECLYQTPSLAVDMTLADAINATRIARGVVPFTDIQIEEMSFSETIISEFRKEFIAEGQLFFFYKRHNLKYIDGAGSDQNMIDLKAYTFPLPNSELQAADRKNNR